MTNTPDTTVELTAAIVSAYLGNNKVVPSDVPMIVEMVFTALATLKAPEHAPEALTPAVPIKKSITPNVLICLEDGQGYRTLKRHLKVAYNMSPDQYREKWGLPSDYPMVAPAYAEARSKIARISGLGRKRG